MECNGCCGWGVISLVYSAEGMERDIGNSDYFHASQVGKVATTFIDKIEQECKVPMVRVREYLEKAVGANTLAKEAHDRLDLVREPQLSAEAKGHVRSAIFELENSLKNACLRER